jgi:hypothetical protein
MKEIQSGAERGILAEVVMKEARLGDGNFSAESIKGQFTGANGFLTRGYSWRGKF